MKEKGERGGRVSAEASLQQNKRKSTEEQEEEEEEEEQEEEEEERKNSSGAYVGTLRTLLNKVIIVHRRLIKGDS